MHLMGFRSVAPETTASNVRNQWSAVRKVDQGSWQHVTDLDPREDFVHFEVGGGISQSILSPEDSSQLSVSRRLTQHESVQLTQESLSESGHYVRLEVYQARGKTEAYLTQGLGPNLTDYRAEGPVAEKLLEDMNRDFETRWNIAR